MDFEVKLLATEEGRRAVRILQDPAKPGLRFCRWFNRITGEWLVLGYIRTPGMGRAERMFRRHLLLSMLWAIDEAKRVRPLRPPHIPFRQRIFRHEVEPKRPRR